MNAIKKAKQGFIPNFIGNFLEYDKKNNSQKKVFLKRNFSEQNEGKLTKDAHMLFIKIFKSL